jgi:hypothetical protein
VSLRRRAACLVAALLVGPLPAKADGAFPDALTVLLPPDAPHRIVVSTNFGLLLSEDDGATWRWACEQAIGNLANQYQLGPAPADRLFAISVDGLSVSSDGACSWTVAAGLDGGRALDVFADPSDARHVLALASLPADGGQSQSALFESRDGAASFGSRLYLAPDGALLTGVEIARASPSTIYLTGFTAGVDPATTRSFIGRSHDGGATFQITDQSATVGTRALGIAAVDPSDPATLYLRGAGQVEARDALVISTDGGASAHIALQLDTRMSGFLRRADGTLLVATRDGQLFTSADAGATFVPSTGVHFRGLAERGGVLYAAADFVVDGFGLALSRDGGATWQPTLAFSQIAGPLTCAPIANACAAPWLTLQGLLGGGGGPVDAATRGRAATPSGGCGCTLAPRPLPLAAVFGVLSLAAVALFRARRR